MWIVLDDEGYRSADEKGEQEAFDSEKAAQRRALELANLFPGKTIMIFRRVAVACAEVAPAAIAEI